MPGPRRLLPDIQAQLVEAPADWGVAALAARQHGVVGRLQLEALGITKGSIEHRVAAGRLHRLHRGVYAVGHTVLGARGRWMASVLACGPTAALSHASAAALWEIRPSAAALVDVTVRTKGGRSRAGLRVHRMPTLRPDEVTTHDGIPVTIPERTVLDLAATLTPRQLERALDQAEIQQLIDYSALAALTRAHRNHRGATRLKATLRRHHPGTTLTRSELEERFLELCAIHGLPRPLVNAHVAEIEVDFLFPAHRLAVETDGWRYHRTRRAFERDRDRDAALTRAGHRVLRFTDRQLTTDPVGVAETLRAALRPTAVLDPRRLRA